MNIPAVSNLLSQQAIKSVAKAKEVAEQNQPFLIQEEPEPASKEASPRSGESQSGGLQGQTMSEDDLRRYCDYRGRVPGMVARLMQQLEWSEKKEEQSLELNSLVWQYFHEAREELGCNTSDYMPYFHGYPEYDPAKEKELQEVFYKKVADDPVCQRLIKSLGGVFPPPEKILLHVPNIEDVFAETRRVLQMSKEELLGYISQTSQSEIKKVDIYI